MNMTEVNVTTLPRAHRCGLCESAEYDMAKRLLQRSGLNPANWGFLLHDIAFQLMTSPQSGVFYSLSTDVSLTDV